MLGRRNMEIHWPCKNAFCSNCALGLEVISVVGYNFLIGSSYKKKSQMRNKKPSQNDTV